MLLTGALPQLPVVPVILVELITRLPVVTFSKFSFQNEKPPRVASSEAQPPPLNPFDETDDDDVVAGAGAAMTPEADEQPAEADIYRVPSSNEPVHSKVPDDVNVLYRVSQSFNKLLTQLNWCSFQLSCLPNNIP